MLPNCWEVKKCGREPGGVKTAELGVCIASTATVVDGVHGGKNAGRACWAIAGTLCGGRVQGTFAEKLANCTACAHYGSVRDSAGKEVVSSARLVSMLKGP